LRRVADIVGDAPGGGAENRMPVPKRERASVRSDAYRLIAEIREIQRSKQASPQDRATSAFAQSAREVRGPLPFAAIENEPAPRLIVDPPLPEPLARGVVQIQYRVENLRIVPVFGAGALTVSPRVGHLHITVDDLRWHWADASDSNTIDVVGLPPGRYKVLIELADPTHRVITGQTVTFTVPRTAS
jgi:hypothetical protein